MHWNSSQDVDSARSRLSLPISISFFASVHKPSIGDPTGGFAIGSISVKVSKNTVIGKSTRRLLSLKKLRACNVRTSCASEVADCRQNLDAFPAEALPKVYDIHSTDAVACILRAAESSPGYGASKILLDV